MNLDRKLSVFLTVAYIVLSILVLFAIYDNNSSNEFIFKVFSLLTLTFLYLTNSNKINIWYLLVLIFSIISDSLLIFGSDFRLEGTICLLLNRVFYIMIVKDVVYQYSIKRLLSYSVPFFLTFFVIFYMVYDVLGDLFYPSLIFGLISVLIGVLSFINYLDVNKPKNLYFFLGIFIIIISDILMTVATFLDETMSYVIIYHILYYIARYIIYRAMVVDKINRSF